jgi:glutamate 5-kinase
MKKAKPLTVVIKLGTSSIVDEKTHEPLLPILTLIVDTAVKLRKDGHRVCIVSSGAIGVGLRRMDVEKRPKHLAQLQALAAIGQCRLMTLWDGLFQHLTQPIAQILLTKNDIADRTRYLNAQNTFNELMDMGVIPIVNENDTLAVSEIKFGDNDTLSAITAAMIHADMLFLMTDVDCLYDKNPRTHPDARPIEVVEDISEVQADGKLPLHAALILISLSSQSNSLVRRFIAWDWWYEHQNHCSQARNVSWCYGHYHSFLKSRKHPEYRPLSAYPLRRLLSH